MFQLAVDHRGVHHRRGESSVMHSVQQQSVHHYAIN